MRARVGGWLRRWADRIDPGGARRWWDTPIGRIEELGEDEHGLSMRVKLFGPEHPSGERS